MLFIYIGGFFAQFKKKYMYFRDLIILHKIRPL